MKKRVHFTDNYLLNPQHPVTVNLIGAGGTGSQVLTCLARLDITLRSLIRDCMLPHMTPTPYPSRT